MYKQILTAVSLAVCLAGPAQPPTARLPEPQPIAAKAPEKRASWIGIAAATATIDRTATAGTTATTIMTRP